MERRRRRIWVATLVGASILTALLAVIAGAQGKINSGLDLVGSALIVWATLALLICAGGFTIETETDRFLAWVEKRSAERKDA